MERPSCLMLFHIGFGVELTKEQAASVAEYIESLESKVETLRKGVKLLGDLPDVDTDNRHWIARDLLKVTE